MLFTPLEQFEVFPILGSNFIPSLSITNIGFTLLLIIAFIFSFSQFFGFSLRHIIPNRWVSLFEIFYLFTLEIVKDNLGTKGENTFPVILSIFFFILFCNLLGLVPYSFTITAQLIVTIALSLIVWVGKLALGFQLHGLKLFSILLPAGLPFMAAPFFVIIELLSFFIPLASLGIRLFANIMAGHILLKVIAGFGWNIMMGPDFLFFGHFCCIIILFLLLFLETAVALIQAYIFAMLTALITGDVLKGSH